MTTHEESRGVALECSMINIRALIFPLRNAITFIENGPRVNGSNVNLSNRAVYIRTQNDIQDLENRYADLLDIQRRQA